MPSAMVFGATGILGRQIVKELEGAPQQWQTIYSFSRSQKEEPARNVVHNFVDLSTSSQEIALQLKNIRADCLFYAAFVETGNEENNWHVNGACKFPVRSK
jgi:N-acetyl-gamma-glutamylphosphate reductase